MLRKVVSGEYRFYSRKISPKSGNRRNLEVREWHQLRDGCGSQGEIERRVIQARSIALAADCDETANFCTQKPIQNCVLPSGLLEIRRVFDSYQCGARLWSEPIATGLSGH